VPPEWLAQFDLPDDDLEDDGAWLCDPDGVGPRLSILKVPEPKTAKNRLHMEIRVPEHGTPDERWARIRAESERLVAGGSVLEVFDGHHIVMADPEGNEFCVAGTSASAAEHRIPYVDGGRVMPQAPKLSTLRCRRYRGFRIVLAVVTDEARL
jgi:hypothetical protein